MQLFCPEASWVCELALPSRHRQSPNTKTSNLTLEITAERINQGNQEAKAIEEQ